MGKSSIISSNAAIEFYQLIDTGKMVRQSIHIISGLIIFIAVFITTTYFSVYFFVKNEQNVVIPDIYGEDIIYVLELLSDNGLNIRVEGTEYHSSIPKNHVIHQSPKPGSEVKFGRDVTVILSKGSKWLNLPDFFGKSIEKAQVILDSHHLCRGEISQVFHPIYEKGLIIAQYPEPGTKVVHNSCINFLVSKGIRHSLYQMPDFLGISFERSLITLNKIDIKPVSINYASDAMWPENRVIDQIPSYGSAITNNEPVIITVNRKGQTLNTFKEGLSLFTYTVPIGILKRHILVRLNIFSVTIHVYDDFYKPSDQLFVFVPNNCEASVFVYQDEELVESKFF
jgi:serine/threonine-protein kinase